MCVIEVVTVRVAIVRLTICLISEESLLQERLSTFSRMSESEKISVGPIHQYNFRGQFVSCCSIVCNTELGAVKRNLA